MFNNKLSTYLYIYFSIYISTFDLFVFLRPGVGGVQIIDHVSIAQALDDGFVVLPYVQQIQLVAGLVQRPCQNLRTLMVGRERVCVELGAFQNRG